MEIQRTKNSQGILKEKKKCWTTFTIMYKTYSKAPVKIVWHSCKASLTDQWNRLAFRKRLTYIQSPD